MKDGKIVSYLCQFSFQTGNIVYLPHTMGVLWAYARENEWIRTNYDRPRFAFVKDRPERIVAAMDEPDIVAFSAYVWNFEISTQCAALIKESYPDCLIVFGGPHVPDRMEGFFRRYPFIDLAVHGEGEITFSEILWQFGHGKEFAEIPGVSVNRGGEEARPYASRDRIQDLASLPSPYLTGVFDDLMESEYDYSVVWETNRGCPYQCTFCDWGSATMTRVRQFSDERLQQEIEWFGEHRIRFIFGGDANFGLLARDVEIAKWLAVKKKASGFPGKFRVNFAKNSTDRVVQIARILNDAELDYGITLSVQSMDADVLQTIKRRNLKIDSLRGFVREYKRQRIATLTEVILGLPGETYQSFVDGIDALLTAGIHDSIYIFRGQVLPNAELNDPDVRAKHQIATKRTPLVMHHANPDDTAVSEYEETIIGTSTMPHEDWKRACLFSFIVLSCHAFKLTQVLAVVLHEICGVRYGDFYHRFAEFAKSHPDTVIGRELRWVERKLDELVQGNLRRNVLEEFASFNWQMEEALYLRLSQSLDGFNADLEQFLTELDTSLSLDLDVELFEDLLRLQRYLVIRWDADADRELVLSHNLYSFYMDTLSLEPASLRKGRYRLNIEDRAKFTGDRRAFGANLAFKGGSPGNARLIHDDVTETPMADEIPELAR